MPPRWRPSSACSRWSRRSATCCCGRTCASTSTAWHGLGDFLELEGVATADSDLADELERVTQLTEALEIAPERILRNSYSDQVVGSDALVDAARAVMERAYAPYSRYRVGAALRAEDGSIHVGANVENAAYPQGQCAEASAIGALVAAGRTQITEVAVIADGEASACPAAAAASGCASSSEPAPRSTCARPPGRAPDATLDALLPRSFGPEYLG